MKTLGERLKALTSQVKHLCPNIYQLSGEIYVFLPITQLRMIRKLAKTTTVFMYLKFFYSRRVVLLVGI